MNDQTDFESNANTIIESLSDKNEKALEIIKNLEASLEELTERLEEKEKHVDVLIAGMNTLSEEVSQSKLEFDKERTQFVIALDGRLAEAEEVSQSAVEKLDVYASEHISMTETAKIELGLAEQARINNEDVFEKIESLLPGATSVGLAQSFLDRKKVYEAPSLSWAATLILTLVGLFMLGIYDFKNIELSEFASSSLWSYFIERLPIVAPAIWLAIYAGRKHGQASRLEEEYAHKEAIAKSFEGFKKQIMEMEEQIEDSNNELSTQYVRQVMDAIALHPSRVFLGKQENVTPFDYLSFWKKDNEAREE